MTHDVDSIVQEAEKTQHDIQRYLRDVADWFHEREGEVFERGDAATAVSNELDLDITLVHKVFHNLIADLVDPIVQIVTPNKHFVGIIEFEELQGAYGYMHFDDLAGRQRRVVCAQCVNEATYDTEVTHATAGDRHGSFDADATYDELLSAIHDHYDTAHSVIPDDIETGATLASGTTIAGNAAFHAGNDGAGSGLAAEAVLGSNGEELKFTGNGDSGFEVVFPNNTSLAVGAAAIGSVAEEATALENNTRQNLGEFLALVDTGATIEVEVGGVRTTGSPSDIAFHPNLTREKFAKGVSTGFIANDAARKSLLLNNAQTSAERALASIRILEFSSGLSTLQNEFSDSDLTSLTQPNLDIFTEYPEAMFNNAAQLNNAKETFVFDAIAASTDATQAFTSYEV